MISGNGLYLYVCCFSESAVLLCRIRRGLIEQQQFRLLKKGFQVFQSIQVGFQFQNYFSLSLSDGILNGLSTFILIGICDFCIGDIKLQKLPNQIVVIFDDPHPNFCIIDDVAAVSLQKVSSSDVHLSTKSSCDRQSHDSTAAILVISSIIALCD